MGNLMSLKKNSKLLKRGRLNIYGVKITKDEHDEFIDDLDNLSDEYFYKKYYIKKDQCIASGNTEKVSKKIMEEVIEEVTTKRGTSYTCFGSDWKGCTKDKPYIIHEDIKGSWQCLIEHMKYPTHLILYKDFNND